MTVSIVGIGCRLPGASSVDELWNMFAEKKSAITAVPRERFDIDVFGGEMPAFHGTITAGIVEDFALDARALRLPPVDAEKMHRLERAALAASAQAMQDAGIFHDAALRARTKTYVASSSLGPDPLTDHSPRIRRHELQEPVSAALALELAGKELEHVDDIIEQLFNLVAPQVDPESLRATAALLAGRIASIHDLTGGHLAVDGGFASSLAALEQAVLALDTGMCDCAVLCAASPLVTPVNIIALAHRGFLAPSSPRPFDPAGDGTVLGEGAVAIVLLRSDRVASSGATAYAAVQGVATTYAGRDPSSEELQRAVKKAAERALAGVDPSRVRAIETRSSGIAVQDRAELSGLAEVYGSRPVTSSVANVGLLPATAGLVGIARAALALKRRSLPPHAPAGPPGSKMPVLANALALDADARIGVDDAGMSDVVGHAVLAVAGEGTAPAHAHGVGDGVGHGHGHVQAAAQSPSQASQAPSQASSQAPRPMNSRARTRRKVDIGIVGLGVVAPKSPDVATFWTNVLASVDSVGDLPTSRFDVDKLVKASTEVGTLLRTRLAATVDVPDVPGAADASIALSLTAVTQAIADAGSKDGWDPERVAVMFGQLPFRCRELDLEKRVLFASHLRLTEDALAEAEVPPEQIRRVMDVARMGLGPSAFGSTSFDALTSLTCPSAVAQRFGFTGPVIAVDAACASSLAAVDAGVEALRRGDVDVAICGGVAYNLVPEYYLALSVLGVLSTRGEPPFSQNAEGFVPGEGAGCVVLMRADDARADSRRMRAVLRGIGVSSDGRGPSVFSPRSVGQVRAVERALEEAGVSADSVDLVEAHGTGTRLGDETELASYAIAYGKRDPSRPLTIGSVKSQMGHLSSAAGALGIIKAVLSLETQTLPPSLLDVDALSLTTDAPIELATVTRSWATLAKRPRRAGVSSFGLGGVNYHAILEEPLGSGATPSDLGPGLAPARGTRADRFEVAVTPLSLPRREKLFTVAHRSCALVPARDERYTKAFEKELVKRGARVRLLPTAGSGHEREAHLARLGRDAMFEIVVDLSTAGTHENPFANPEAFIDTAVASLSASLGLMRALYADFAEAAPRTRAFVAVSTLGDMGLLGADPTRVVGAALLGLTKGIKVELGNVLAKGIDLDPSLDPARAATLALDELEDGNDRLEVAYGASGRRVVMNLQRAAHDDAARPPRPVDNGDVHLFTGGGRGIVFECALSLAHEGARVIVCGRTPAPAADAAFVLMDDAAFAEHRNSELLRLRSADRTMTPAAFAQKFESVERQRELGRNLIRARTLGVDLEYRVCDVNDGRAVRELVASVRAQHGRIACVIHGAMVEWSTSIAKKTDAVAARTVQTKAAGFLHLVRALADDPPQTFLSFSSGAGRFGNMGQSDYCAANNLLAALTTSASRVFGSSTRFCTIDWTAWADAGAAVRSAGLVKNLGLTTIRATEGCYWFASELARGRAREVIVFEESMLDRLRFLGDTPEGENERAVLLDDAGAPLVPGHWPLVDFVVERTPSSVFVERTLDIDRDRFLSEHRLNGAPILPATFGCELLAEAAALTCPGFEVESVLDADIEAPAKLHRGEPLTLRVVAQRIDRTGDRIILDAESRSDLMLHGKALQQGRLHHRARITLRPVGSGAVTTLAIPELDCLERARSFFHLAQDPVTLGPLFCRARWIRIVDRDITGEVQPPRMRDVVQDSSWPCFQVDPLTLDAGFQVAANWDGYINGNVSIPVGVAAIHVRRKRGRGETARVWARVIRVEDPVVTYDIDVVGDRAEVLLEVRGLRLHRVARVRTP